MKHVWSVLSQRSITDQETNSVSLVDVIEELNIPIDKKKFKEEGKVSLSGNFIISHLILKDEKLEEEKGTILIQFFDPSGKKHKNEVTQEIEIKKPHKRIRARIMVNEIAFKEPGIYTFVVKMKSNKDEKYKKVAELPLDVNFLEITKESGKK